MGKRDVLLVVEKGNRECEEAEEFLKKLGVEFTEIDIDKNDLRGWMYRDIGTTRVPLLLTSKFVLAGIEDIKKYAYILKETM